MRLWIAVALGGGDRELDRPAVAGDSRPAGQNWPLLARLIVFGRWPSSAAFSGSLKPGALRVRSKGEKYWSERCQRAGRQVERLRGALAGAEDAALAPGRFGADHGVGEERGAARAGE